MKVNLKNCKDFSCASFSKNENSISFKGFYNSKVLKKGLEFAANNGALFAASTTLALSATVRPISIMLTPKTDKENKKIACAKSLSSSAVGFLMTFGLSLPLAYAVKNIDKNPRRYLKSDTIKAYDKKAYAFATQMFKLGLSAAIAIPKAILTAAGLPYIMDGVFPEKDNGLSFRGKERLSRTIGKVLDNKNYQKFSDKYKNSNFPLHICNGTDILTTSVFINQTANSKKIKNERKKALICNASISTILSIACGYVLDNLTAKPTKKFIQNFRNANKGLPNLEKQVEGIKIAKPILLLAFVYYTLIPLISTFLADRVGENSLKPSQLDFLNKS